jgi:hypothetical protein
MIMVDVQLLVEILRAVSQALVLIALIIELIKTQNRREYAAVI